MTDKEIVERAKAAEKRTGFGELVHSPLSKGVNSAYGIGFVEGMVEYRNSLPEEPVSEDLDDAVCFYKKSVKIGNTQKIDIRNVYIPNAFKAGAQWDRERTIDKACKWIRRCCKCIKNLDKMVDDFRKALEKED